MRSRDDRVGAIEIMTPKKKMRSAPSLYVWDKRFKYRDPVTSGRASPGGIRGRKLASIE